MSRWFLLWLVFALAGLTLPGCAQGATSSVPPAEKGSVIEAIPRADWEVKWENALARARSEGIVRVYSNWRQETRVLLSQAFKEKYGIELEFTMFSRGAELVGRVQAEKRAGLHVADVLGAGGTTLIGSMKPEGLLSPAAPLLVLPEVTDPKLWRGGELPIKDNGGYAVSMLAGLQRFITYNSDMIREGEIASHKDLLKPQYKGKIAINDPSVAGQGNAWFSHLAGDLWNVEEASEFFRQLLKQQEAVIQRDNRLHVEWVARGKYPIGLAAAFPNVTEFTKLGAPIRPAVPKEGDKILSGSGSFGIPAAPAHPNATLVFVNWLLSKEGQTLFVKGFGIPSLRLDVAAEGIDPIFLPGPQERIFYDSEDDILFRSRMVDVARTVLASVNQ